MHPCLYRLHRGALRLRPTSPLLVRLHAADLQGAGRVEASHIAEALSHRRAGQGLDAWDTADNSPSLFSS